MIRGIFGLLTLLVIGSASGQESGATMVEGAKMAAATNADERPSPVFQLDRIVGTELQEKLSSLPQATSISSETVDNFYQYLASLRAQERVTDALTVAKTYLRPAFGGVVIFAGIYFVIWTIVQVLGFVYSTKLNLLQVIGDLIMSATAQKNSSNEGLVGVAEFMEDPSGKSGSTFPSSSTLGISVGDLIMGARRVADAIDLYSKDE